MSNRAGKAWLFPLLFLSAFILQSGEKGIFSVVPSFDLSYSSNIFWDSSQVSDMVYYPGLSLEYNRRGFSLFIRADGRLYGRNSDLNSLGAAFGVDFFRVFSKRNSIFFSVETGWYVFNTALSELNSLMPSLIAGWKHAFSDHFFFRGGLNLRYSHFSNYSLYDRYQVSGFAEFNLFLHTQTLLRSTVGYNHISLPGLEDIQVQPTDPGFGHGNHHNPENSTASGSLTMAQPYAGVRISQAFGAETALIGDFQFRGGSGVSAGLAAFIAEEWALQQMNEDFFWEGPRWALAFKTEKLKRTLLNIEFSIADKTYTGITALDAAGGVITPEVWRRDRLTELALRLEREFGSMRIKLNLIGRKNRSNDLYFDYEYFTISLGLDYRL